MNSYLDKPLPALRIHGGYWTCIWYDRDGKRRWRRLGFAKKVSRNEAQQKYAEILQDASHGKLGSGNETANRVTIAQFVEAYLEYAKDYYVGQDKRPTGELSNMAYALEPLCRFYGQLPLENLRPSHIRKMREEMVNHGLARRTINDRIKRLRRALKWAVSHEMVGYAVIESVKAVEPLRYGRTPAPDHDPIKPVPLKEVAAVLRLVAPTVRTMILVQYRTGMRPREVCNMRWCDIDQTRPVWKYNPFKHKTRWAGKSRVIAIGPRAQRCLKQYAAVDSTSFIFSPRRALQEIYGRCPNHRRKINQYRKTSRKVSDHYVTNAYRQAIQDACEKAKIRPWAPNQLRHSLATRVRQQYGLEHAQAVLGHSKIETTQIYAQQNMVLAEEVMSSIG